MDTFWQFLDARPLTQGVDGGTFLLSLLLSFVLGQLLAWVYYFTHNSLSYSKSFVQSLIIITMAVALVMATISGSFVIAVGLMGALSLIRFRNIIKDTRDIAFLFCAVVIGMACGSQRYAIAIIGTLTLCLVLIYLHIADFGMHHSYNAFLRFSFDGTIEPNHPVLSVLKKFSRSFTLISSNSSAPDEGYMDYAYQLSLRTARHNELLLSEIRKIEGVHNVSLTMQEQLLEM
ncbi:MAG: DUF4956 domain-containing protein [Planctomycetes bacterium]|jgi:uncharacterized membrane protein YhiD involved in acid resistance|nr:DUF4956 domain-containing protein [Planctomycetota bacterium]